jgi:hypothetical protein
MGAVRHVTIVGREHPPSDRVDTVGDAVHAHAVAPGVAGVDRGIAVVHPLPVRIQHLETARAGVDPLAESDDDLVRRFRECGIRRRITRGGDGVTGHVTGSNDRAEQAQCHAEPCPAVRPRLTDYVAGLRDDARRRYRPPAGSTRSGGTPQPTHLATSL